MIDPATVTPCLVTRGNVPLDEIRATLDAAGYAPPIVWDNSRERRDRRIFGRYLAAMYFARTEFIYWQDDDVLFTDHAALIAAYEPGVFTANNAHGPNPGGYDDLALQAAGAICPRALIGPTWKRWFDVYSWTAPRDREIRDLTAGDVPTFEHALELEADFVFGVLCSSWKQVNLPYTRLYADDDSRLCRQPWQEALKSHVTELARAIRDRDTTKGSPQ